MTVLLAYNCNQEGLPVFPGSRERNLGSSAAEWQRNTSNPLPVGRKESNKTIARNVLSPKCFDTFDSADLLDFEVLVCFLFVGFWKSNGYCREEETNFAKGLSCALASSGCTVAMCVTGMNAILLSGCLTNCHATWSHVTLPANCLVWTNWWWLGALFV